MSGQASGWVWSNSPMKGAAFTVHLAIADVVNDAHDNTFWMSATALAKKARTTRETATRTLTKLRKMGLIERLSPEALTGHPTEYRFIMEGVTESHTRYDVGAHQGVTESHTPETKAPNESSNETELKVNMSESLFDEAYKNYPKHVGKGAARRAYKSALKKISHEEMMVAIGKVRFAWEGKDPQFIPHFATWLNGERWSDEEPPAHAEGAPIPWYWKPAHA